MRNFKIIKPKWCPSVCQSLNEDIISRIIIEKKSHITFKILCIILAYTLLNFKILVWNILFKIRFPVFQYSVKFYFIERYLFYIYIRRMCFIIFNPKLVFVIFWILVPQHSLGMGNFGIRENVFLLAVLYVLKNEDFKNRKIEVVSFFISIS